MKKRKSKPRFQSPLLMFTKTHKKGASWRLTDPLTGKGKMFQPDKLLQRTKALKSPKAMSKMVEAAYNKATGWLSVQFPAKPTSDILAELKTRGFRWKPRSKRWSAKWSVGREDYAKMLAGEIQKIDIKPDWQRKAEYAGAQAAKHRKESNERFDRTWKSMQTIPIGQPILVGHHSEKRHRSHLKRIDKGFEIARREEGIAEKYSRRAERMAMKAAGEDPVTIFNRVQRLEAEERDFQRRLIEKPTSEHSKRWLSHIQERLKIEREKYKASGGIVTEKIEIKPGDRVTTRWGHATIKTISKKSARVAFDNLKTSIYGMSTDSKIDITSITGKLPSDKKYVFTQIKKEVQLKPFVGKQVTIAGEQHTHLGSEIYGTVRFAKQGKIVKEGNTLFFVEKGEKTKQPISVGKLTMGRREKTESGLHVKEIRPTW